MAAFAVISLIVLLGAPSAPTEASWERASQQAGVTVYKRIDPASGLTELKAIGTFDVPPRAVWNVILDYASYPRTMPYMEASEVLRVEEGGRVLYVYNRVAAPLIDKRDYVLKVRDESDGSGVLLLRWTAHNEGGPPPVPGVVRVTRNDGYWRLEPIDGGRRTFATYYVFTDPGGSVPRFIVNTANSSAIPDIYKAVRKYAKPDAPAPAPKQPVSSEPVATDPSATR